MRDEIAQLKNRMKDMEDEMEILQRKDTREMTVTARQLFQNELKNFNKPKCSRRYPKCVRDFCLQLSYLSTAAYLHLSSVFSLPSLRTLRRDLAAVTCQPGVLPNAIKEVRSKIDSGIYGSDCILMYDEMAIHQGFCWNPTTKSYMGYETLPHEGKESERTATHLFVFLLKGLVNGWEYPVAYFFTQALSHETIRLSLSEVLKALHESGIYPGGIAFDGLVANLAAAKSLGACLDVNDMRPYFKHPFADETVQVFPDIPHMLKLVRNMLFESERPAPTCSLASVVCCLFMSVCTDV
jgi:DNA transposase THAP9